MKKFELWLDETGNFTKSQQLNGIEIKGEKDGVPSMIGGILLPMDTISNKRAEELVGEGGHTVDMSEKQIRECLVPALTELKEKGAKFVYFENKRREYRSGFSDLYLEMITDGILQLMSFLSMYDQEYQLDILIALRSVPNLNGEKNENGKTKLDLIEMEEYKAMLIESMTRRIEEGRMYLDEDIKVNILLSKADDKSKKGEEDEQKKRPNVDFKLQLADYACRARRAHLSKIKSAKFQDDVLEIISGLFDENYSFTFKEYPMVEQVRRKLASKELAEAMQIYCSDRGLLRNAGDTYYRENEEEIRAKTKWMIQEQMRQLGKLEVRCQMEELLSDINSAVRMELECEWSEVFLRRLKEEFLDEMKKYEFYDERLDLEFSLAFSYLYLREGDMVNLEKELSYAEELFAKLPQCPDYMDEWMEIQLLRLDLAMNTGDFETAMEKEELLEKHQEAVRKLYQELGVWKSDRKMVSGQLGLEANRRIQMRHYLSWKNRMEDLTDPELEEMALGIHVEELAEKSFDEEIRRFPSACFNYLVDTAEYIKAVSWILSFVGVKVEEEKLKQVTYLREKLDDFCSVLLEMDGKQKIELLRDYLYAMYRCRKNEIAAMDTKMVYSSLMYEALVRSGLLEILEQGNKEEKEIKTNRPITEEYRYRHLVRNVLKDYRDKIYHPMEQVWWFLGAYAKQTKATEKKSEDYYKYASNVCDQNQEYELMVKNRMMMNAEIIAEKICKSGKVQKEDAVKLKRSYEQVLTSDAVTESSKVYMTTLWEPIFDMLEKGMPAEVVGEVILDTVWQMYL